MSEPSTITVRTATAKDAPALGRLGALLVETHHAFDPERFIPSGPDMSRGYGRFLAGELDREEVIVLVAEDAEAEGAVLGYAYAELEGQDWLALRGPAGVIHDLAVDPARRGEGIGRRLLEQTMAALLERGAPRVVLSAAWGNEAARRLFARAGFRPTMVEMTREP